MSNNGSFKELVIEVDVAIAERRHLRARGIHLLITHLYRLPGTMCAPGEMVGDIALGGVLDPSSLCLSPRAMLIIDCLYRYRIPLTAQRIAHILNTDPFYANQGANGSGGASLAFWFDQRAIRVYMDRIQERMATLFSQFRLSIDPYQVLKCVPTESNQTVYALHATVECRHVDLGGQNAAFSWWYPAVLESTAGENRR
jgi:hypothetical protein